MRGFLLLTVTLLAITRVRAIQNEEVWEAILYGYVIDYDSPAYLGRGDKIFSIPEADHETYIAISANPIMTTDVVYSDSETTAAENFAVSVGIEGSYGAFSLAASMGVSSSSDTSVKTVRVDSLINALKYEVSAIDQFRTYPQRFLSDNFRESVMDLTVQEIERLIGSFYARRLDLGGEVKKSYVMQASSSDTMQSIEAELTASYGGNMMGGSVSTSTSYGYRESNSEAEMSARWYVKGGDTTKWLMKDFSVEGADAEVAEVQAQWSETINDQNLHGFNFELGYMWDLVKEVNMAKGLEYQAYLENKWEMQASEFTPNEFLAAQGPALIEGFRIKVSDRDHAYSSGKIRMGVRQGGRISCESISNLLDRPQRGWRYTETRPEKFGSCRYTEFDPRETIEIQLLSDSGDDVYIDNAGIKIDGEWKDWVDHHVKVNKHGTGSEWRVVHTSLDQGK